MGKKRIWYHCTTENYGRLWTAVRRPPEHADKDELPVPRLCACRWVPDCIGARLYAQGLPVYVYATQGPMASVPPRGVWDAGITGERWLVPPVPMERVGAIPPEVMERLQGAVRWFHQETGQPSSPHRRFTQLTAAWAVLGPVWHPASGLPAKLQAIWDKHHPGMTVDDYWLEELTKAQQATRGTGRLCSVPSAAAP